MNRDAILFQYTICCIKTIKLRLSVHILNEQLPLFHVYYNCIFRIYLYFEGSCDSK